MMITNANSDCQFISSGLAGIAIAYYISNYITQGTVSIDNLHKLKRAAWQATIGKPLTQHIPKQFNDNQRIIRDFFIRFFNKLQGATQVSGNEVATRLLKLPMAYKSDEFVTLNVYDIVSKVEDYRKKMYR